MGETQNLRGFERMIETTRPKPFVFVLMPFHPDFDDVYQLGIKAACAEAGAYCERVDEQIFGESILSRIYNQIAKADLVIADMSGRNANVFYEAGYAHALGKRVVLLTQDAADIPFDLKHYSHLVYGGKITQLKTDLIRTIGAILADSQEKGPITPILQVFHHGVEITDGSEVSTRNTGFFSFTLRFDIHNPTNWVIDPGSVQIAVVTSADFSPASASLVGSSRLPDGRRIHFYSPLEKLFPGSWTPISFELTFKNTRAFSGGGEEFVLRQYSSGGFRDIAFTALIKSSIGP